MQTGELPLTINQLEYSVGPHVLVIEVRSDDGISVSTEVEFDGIDEDSLPGTNVLYYVPLHSAHLYYKLTSTLGPPLL